jgi:hypothetical protein
MTGGGRCGQPGWAIPDLIRRSRSGCFLVPGRPVRVPASSPTRPDSSVPPHLPSSGLPGCPEHEDSSLGGNLLSPAQRPEEETGLHHRETQQQQQPERRDPRHKLSFARHPTASPTPAIAAKMTAFTARSARDCPSRTLPREIGIVRSRSVIPRSRPRAEPIMLLMIPFTAARVAGTSLVRYSGGPEISASASGPSARQAVTLVRSGTAAVTEQPPVIQSSDSPARQIRPGTDAAATARAPGAQGGLTAGSPAAPARSYGRPANPTSPPPRAGHASRP